MSSTSNSTYDEAVRSHYDRIAGAHGLSPKSTMADDTVRAKETRVAIEFVERIGRELWAEAMHSGADVDRPSSEYGAQILDVGCGNGYTLRRLADHLPMFGFTGIEYNDRLRTVAEQQLAGRKNARVQPGDLRARESLEVPDEQVDALLCQRVIINLLDREDQRVALENIIRLVRPGGYLLFIEAFEQGLSNLNDARAEFGLEPIEPAVHNLYLPDEFFQHHALQPAGLDGLCKANLLSTHYYLSRVLHEATRRAAGSSEVQRNSHFVRFLSSALPDEVGDYSPIRIHHFKKQPT